MHDNPPPIPLRSIELSDTHAINVSINHRAGSPGVSLRLWSRFSRAGQASDQMSATRRGIFVNAAVIPALADTLREALESLAASKGGAL